MTPHVDAYIVNAFTDAGEGGNPAGVVLDADALTATQKLHVAREVGLSETAFVSRSDIATVKLEFFTPTRQIAHCGHATVAAFSLLLARGRVGEGALSKDTIDGLRDIRIEDGRVFMGQRAPRYQDFAAEDAAARDVAASLRLAEAPRPATIVDTGNRFLMLELDGAGDVAALQPDQAAIAALSAAHDLIGYYVFSREARRPGRIASARMFAPAYGIDEEAATGMAAGALACFLHDRRGAPATMRIEQGTLMPAPSPSVIEVRLDVGADGIGGVLAGGNATLRSQRQVPL